MQLDKQLIMDVLMGMGALSDRGKEVLKLRFGLDSGLPKTLLEVGKELCATQERIRQVESKCLDVILCHIMRKRAKRIQELLETNFCMDIRDLNINSRLFYILKREGITTVEKLLTYTDTDLESIRGLGKKGIYEIQQGLKNLLKK